MNYEEKYRYEVVLYCDKINDWVLYQSYIQLGSAKEAYRRLTNDAHDLEIMVYDRWEEEVVEQND